MKILRGVLLCLLFAWIAYVSQRAFHGLATAAAPDCDDGSMPLIMKLMDALHLNTLKIPLETPTCEQRCVVDAMTCPDRCKAKAEAAARGDPPMTLFQRAVALIDGLTLAVSALFVFGVSMYGFHVVSGFFEQLCHGGEVRQMKQDVEKFLKELVAHPTEEEHPTNPPSVAYCSIRLVAAGRNLRIEAGKRDLFKGYTLRPCAPLTRHYQTLSHGDDVPDFTLDFSHLDIVYNVKYPVFDIYRGRTIRLFDVIFRDKADDAPEKPFAYVVFRSQTFAAHAVSETVMVQWTDEQRRMIRKELQWMVARKMFKHTVSELEKMSPLGVLAAVDHCWPAIYENSTSKLLAAQTFVLHQHEERYDDCGDVDFAVVDYILTVLENIPGSTLSTLKFPDMK